ncbi:MAG: ATP-binding protein, partial [Nitrososphaera sp.]
SIGRAWNAVSGAKHEVLILFSTPSAFRRQLDMGAQKVLYAAHANGSSVRILVPSGPGLGEPIEEIRKKLQGTNIRLINEKLRTNITIVIVDGRDCFIFELRDDSKKQSFEAIGIALYSNSRSIVSSYSAIIESLWRETDLYQKLENHDRMQREFINIATHELRTPIQPILGLSEILATRAPAGSEDKELLGAIWRNAQRLNKLAEAILDVTKIESQALNLHRDVFDLNEVIASAVGDVVISPAVTNSMDGVNISVVYADSKAYVQGDKDRILQVISNLLANAVKFTENGSIVVLVRIETRGNAEERELAGNLHEKYVTVKVKDSGAGIDNSVFPRLFTKFASGSTWGTGLGLYISKGIIEAHGGSITAKNNDDDRGATFAFSIPFHDSQKST